MCSWDLSVVVDAVVTCVPSVLPMVVSVVALEGRLIIGLKNAGNYGVLNPIG